MPDIYLNDDANQDQMRELGDPEEYLLSQALAEIVGSESAASKAVAGSSARTVRPRSRRSFAFEPSAGRDRGKRSAELNDIERKIKDEHNRRETESAETNHRRSAQEDRFAVAYESRRRHDRSRVGLALLFGAAGTHDMLHRRRTATRISSNG